MTERRDEKRGRKEVHFVRYCTSWEEDYTYRTSAETDVYIIALQQLRKDRAVEPNSAFIAVLCRHLLRVLISGRISHPRVSPRPTAFWFGT